MLGGKEGFEFERLCVWRYGFEMRVNGLGFGFSPLWLPRVDGAQGSLSKAVRNFLRQYPYVLLECGFRNKTPTP